MRNILVTGSAGNLGKAIVQKFTGQGDRVLGTVTHIDDAAKSYSHDLFEEQVVDVSDELAAKQFIERAVLQYGSIDAAVLTVGGFAKGTIMKSGTSEMVNQYKINFETAYNIAQPLFVQMMQQNRGRIFLVGSRPGLDAKSSRGMVAYGLAKSLLVRLAELMNDEAGKSNVVTSVVVPSTIDTPVNRKFMPEADFKTWVQPEAIADVIYFYCSDQAAVLREPVIKVYNQS